MRRWSRKLTLSVTAGGVALATLTGTVLASPFGKGDNPWPYAAARTPVLVAVGDIACQPDANSQGNETAKPDDTCTQSDQAAVDLRNQAQAATADQVESLQPNLVAILGDEQYQVGTYADFEGSFDRTYGAFKFLQRPAPGNHEFYDAHGQKGDDGVGYFDYYNGVQLDPNTGQAVLAADPFGNYVQPVPRPSGQAGNSDEGWYSYNLGSWHVISLNAECAVNDPTFKSCADAPAWFAQETQWLKQDLASNHASCTVAYWHQPTFSASKTPASATQPGSGGAEGTATQQWWQLLYSAGADLVLNGHEHLYARFAPMNPTGAADPKKGIREFIVGTGGEGLDNLYTDTGGNVAVPNLQDAQGQGAAFAHGQTTSFPGAFGVMKLSLDSHGYSWDYQSAAAPTSNGTPAWGSFSDTGSASCHGPAKRHD